MSSYRCVLLLLVACMTAVCMDGGEALIFRQIVNVGDSYTFDCNVVSNYDHYWSRSESYFSSLSGTSVSDYSDDERVSSSYSNGQFSLTVLTMTDADSGNYDCKYYNTYNQIWVDVARYNAHVVGCSCTVAQPYYLRSGSKTVTCILDDYPPSSFGRVKNIIYPNPGMSGTIQGNELTFRTNNDLREDLTITFNPFTNVEGDISCVVPAIPIITTTTLEITPSMSTSVTSSTDHTTTPPSTMSTSNPSTPNNVTRTPSVSSATISRVMAPGEQKNKSQRTLIIGISAVGSLLILLLIIVIILLRSRKRQEHAPNAAYHSQNGTNEEKGKVEETDMCYTSIQDTSPPEHLGGSRNTAIKAPTGVRDSNKNLTGSGFDHDGMVDNILYDFTSDSRGSRAIADPSTVDACGPLYAMPDKTSKSADRASVMSKRDLSNGQEAMHPSLASRGRCDVTPSQTGVPRCEDRARDDDGGVVDMYGVPDKGPGSRKEAVTYSFAEAADGTGADASYVNVNLSSNTAQPEPGDIAALYAVVDKREKN